jgi:hypothetical protein
MDWVGLEYQVVAAVVPPAVVAILAFLVDHLRRLERDKQIGPWLARLVMWAQQSIPDKSQRYAEVASLLSTRFPHLQAHEVEVLIESEVQALKLALGRVTSAVPAPPDLPGAAATPVASTAGSLRADAVEVAPALTVVQGGQ